jgi:hypothetical protein
VRKADAATGAADVGEDAGKLAEPLYLSPREVAKARGLSIIDTIQTLSIHLFRAFVNEAAMGYT